MKKVHKISDIVKKEIMNNISMKKEILRANWGEIIGKVLAEKSEPTFIKNNILFISVENSAWLQQMQFLKNQILENVNKYLNGKYIFNISLKIKKKEKRENYNIKNKKQDTTNKIDIKNITLQKEDIIKIKTITSRIEDPDLKRKLYNIISNNRKRDIFLLKKGFKKCEKCGVLFESTEKLCIECTNDIKKIRETEIINIIKKNPAISFFDVKDIIRDLKEVEFKKLKNKLKDKIYNELLILKNEKNTSKMKELLFVFFVLETGIYNESIINKKVLQFLKSFT